MALRGTDIAYSEEFHEKPVDCKIYRVTL